MPDNFLKTELPQISDTIAQIKTLVESIKPQLMAKFPDIFKTGAIIRTQDLIFLAQEVQSIIPIAIKGTRFSRGLLSNLVKDYVRFREDIKSDVEIDPLRYAIDCKLPSIVFQILLEGLGFETLVAFCDLHNHHPYILTEVSKEGVGKEQVEKEVLRVSFMPDRTITIREDGTLETITEKWLKLNKIVLINKDEAYELLDLQFLLRESFRNFTQDQKPFEEYLDYLRIKFPDKTVLYESWVSVYNIINRYMIENDIKAAEDYIIRVLKN